MRLRFEVEISTVDSEAVDVIAAVSGLATELVAEPVLGNNAGQK